ncbi:hypothetical protein MPSEU_000587700 [Mayamaea pseudoterrestris]|nr:hypothetical protein MPSEU_000587700 [Mayamaea pseudoterrestris]
MARATTSSSSKQHKDDATCATELDLEPQSRSGRVPHADESLHHWSDNENVTSSGDEHVLSNVEWGIDDHDDDKDSCKDSSAIHTVGTNKTQEEVFRLQLLTGVKQDLAARLPYYADDWGRPKSFVTILNASIYAFIIQLIPALIFAEIMNEATEGNLSTAETLLSSAIAGILYAILAGQPLTLLGITGLVAILVKTSYSLAATFHAEYFSFFFWTCVWAGLFHILSAMVGIVSLVWKVTPFTTQIFELFTALTFMYLSLENLVGPILEKADPDMNLQERYAELSLNYASFLLGLLTMYVSWTLHFADQWGFFTRQVRIFLSRYNTMIAIVLVTAVSYIPAFNQADNGSQGLPRVSVEFPWDWQPTADRTWVANPLQNIGAAGIFGAMIPGLMFFLLFFIDHNVSSILSQTADFNLAKPPAYNWDFLVLGITFFPCAILGLPPASGLLPQAPLHTRALCTREYYVDEFGIKRERVTHCEEQRWSALAQACLMFVALVAFRVVSWIPRGALFGLLLYLGMGALHVCEVWERILLMVTLPKRRPLIPIVKEVEWKVVQTWTIIQTVCTLIIWGVATFVTGLGYLYPVFLFLLVPLRSLVLERVFDKRDLRYLDPFGDDEAVDDYRQEQRLFHAGPPPSDSMEADDVDFPTRAAFRGQGRRGHGSDRSLVHRARRHTLGDANIADILPHDMPKMRQRSV